MSDLVTINVEPPLLLTIKHSSAEITLTDMAGKTCVSWNIAEELETGRPVKFTIVAHMAAASWRPEDHLPSDPNARPPQGDLAGWCRFYAWGYDDRPWGEGEGDYTNDCQSMCFQQAADEIDSLRGQLASLRI